MELHIKRICKLYDMHLIFYNVKFHAEEHKCSFQTKPAMQVNEGHLIYLSPDGKEEHWVGALTSNPSWQD